MKKLTLGTSISVCALAIASFLTTSESATKWECGERSNLPLEGKNYCAAGDFRQSEINLEKLFDAMLQRYRAAFGDASVLKVSQNAFEVYRDNQCLAESKRVVDKPFYSMIVAQCKTRITSWRINELKRMQQQSR